MSVSLLTPDLRRILADLGRRVGILERRVSPPGAGSLGTSSYLGVNSGGDSLAPDTLYAIAWTDIFEQSGSGLSVTPAGVIRFNRSCNFEMTAYAFTPSGWGNAVSSYLRLQVASSAQLVQAATRGGLSIPFASWAWHANAGDDIYPSVRHDATSNVSVTVIAYVRATER